MGPLSRNEQACNDPESRNVVVLAVRSWKPAEASDDVSGSSGNNL